MENSKAFSTLIGDIYDASLDPALWPAVLEQCARYVEGCGAALYVKDSVNKQAIIDRNYSVGIEDRFTERYLQTYVKIDPATTAMFFFDVGEVTSAADLLPLNELFECRFFKEWMQPQGLIDAASTLLDKSATSYSAFCVFRHQRNGLVDDPCRRRMRLLVPHVRRAVLIGKTIQLRKADADAFADALDGIASAIFLVNSSGRLVHANARGHVLLADATIVRASGGRLVANDAGTDQALQEAIAATEGGDCQIGMNGIALALPGHDGRYVAHVLPLTSGARSKAGHGWAATAAVFVRNAELNQPAMPEVLAKAYGLTPSELRVLLSVYDKGGVSNIAESLGVSEATAKTHLRRLFEKTGTRRQDELVKLVAGFAAPVG